MSPSNYAAEDGSFTQPQLSAVESDNNINSQDKLVNGTAFLTGKAALAPGEARDASSWRNVMDEMMRGLDTRSVLEGLGDVSDTFLNRPVNAVGRLFG